MALVGKTIELGTDLAKLGGNQLFVAAALIRLWVHERALGMQIELARSLYGHLLPEQVAELDDLPGADEFGRGKHRCGLHVISRTALVTRAPFGGTAFTLGRRLPGLGGGK